MQDTFAFPQPLSEKYRPARIADFIGLEKPKRLALNLVSTPKETAFFFLGPSGTGKTSLALAIAAEMPAELHHIASRDCTLDNVQRVVRQCYNMPRMFNDWSPAKMHLVLVDEADQMSQAAAVAFLSILDATEKPPNTIFIFTGNSTANLEKRFMSRCHEIEFSSYGMAPEIVGLLSGIWATETNSRGTAPNFGRIVKDSCNNVRDALMSLETELMCA